MKYFHEQIEAKWQEFWQQNKTFVAKKIILGFLFLVNFISVAAQEIAIPYRDGKKWGMCDIDGKIIIEPQYDNIVFEDGYNSDYQSCFSKLNGKTGLITNGKIILEAKYDDIQRLENAFAVSNKENGEVYTDIIDKNGVSILKKPIVAVLKSELIDTNYYINIVLNKNLTQSAFIVNIKTNIVEQYLYEDYYSIDIKEINYDYEKLIVTSKKIEKDDLLTETWNIYEKPLVKFVKQDIDEKKSIKQSELKPNKKKLDIEPTPEKSLYSQSKKPIKAYRFRYQKNNDIALEIIQVKTKETKVIPISIKIADENIEIVYFEREKETKDSLIYFENYIFYKTKDKTGLIFPENIKKIIEFDTITKNTLSFRPENLNETFLVGNKNPKTKIFKYSMYSIEKGLLFPMQFDEFINIFSERRKIEYYKTRMGDKFGLIDSKGNELLKTEYEDFIEEKTNFFTVNKNNKYGFIYKNYDVLASADAIFDYQIKAVYYNYPYNEESEFDSKLTIVTLKNENEKILGYANINGKLYFKN